MNCMQLEAGMELLCVRSSNILFVMGAKGLCWKEPANIGVKFRYINAR